MAAAIDTEQCTGCPAIKICTRWNSSGTWDYTKGKNPCRPVKIYARPRITEEPIPNPRPESCKGCIAEGTCTIDQQFVCSRKYYCKPAVSTTDKMHIIIDDKNTPITPIIDAEQVQRDRFRLRDQK